MRSAVSVAVLLTAVASAGSAQQRTELPAKDTPLRDRPADVWAVGVAEGRAWEMLSGVRGAAFDAQDNLYVLDSGNHRVLVFDRSGTFVRQFGKQGGGPGEFQFPMDLAILPSGDLVVLEPRGYSIFAPDGTYKDLVAAGGGLGSLQPDAFGAHPDGGVVVRRRQLPEANTELAEGATMPAPILREPLDGGQPETLAALVEPAPTVREMPGQGGRTMRMVMMQAPPTFSRPLRWALRSDGSVAVAETTDAWEVKIASDGRFVRTLTRPLTPRAATERDRDAAREERRKSLASGGNTVRIGGGGAFFSQGGGSGMPEDQIRQMLAEMEFAETVAIIRDLFADGQGRLWVQRAPAVWGQPSPVDLIAGDRYVGTVMGVELPLAVSASGLAAWVEKDDLDVERVVVRKLPDSWK